MMSSDVKFIISENDRNGILSDNYLIRYHSCNRVLKDNNIAREIYQLRRVFKLISSNTNDVNSLNEALKLLEIYVINFNKDIEFDKLEKTEINELFLDSCYDFENFTHEKAVKFFEHGVDVNTNSSEFDSSFHRVSKSSNLNLIKEFLTRGANVNAKFYENETGTIWNFNHSCNLEKIKLFLEFGAQINSQKNNGNTVMHDLCETHSNVIDALNYLIEKGADINIKEIAGKSLLHLAARTSNKETITFLIKKGLDINLKDNNGDTPLVIATCCNQIMTVQILIEHGADKSIKNSAGQTPYEIALSRKYLDLAQVFDWENAIKDYQNRADYAEILRIKGEIIQKFKSGKIISSCDKEGSDTFEYTDGVYKRTYYDEFGNLDSEYIYKTDDEAMERLIGYVYNNDELERYKRILERLSY